MTDTEIKQRITALSNNQKQEEFPAALAKTSFSNSRKYYRFMNNIELEFGICFSYNDLDKTYSMEDLSKKVSERLGNKKSNLSLLQQRLKVKDRYIVEIILLVLVIAVFAWQKTSWLSISFAILSAAIIYWLVSKKLSDRQHNKKLQDKMNQGS